MSDVMTVPIAAEVRQALRQADSLIGELGWRQGDFGCAQGPVCLYGALRLATGYTPNDPLAERDVVYLAASDAVSAHLGLQYRCEVADWNDEHARTADEVKAALRAAAEAYPQVVARG